MMTLRYPSEWIDRARDALAQLADRPWHLLAILLLVNAIAQPYAGITHDTRLYSVQVLNQVEGGTYSDDLFFRYGSQDDYSLFSRLTAPLVATLGIHAAFFVLYVLGKSLILWAMLRLVSALIPNKTAVVLTLLFCMIDPIRYGGMKVLHVQEIFVTPRMFAIGLTLLGLDFLLRQRPIASLCAILFGLALHPLMAFGGLLIWLGFHLWTLVGGRLFAALCLGLTAIAGGVLFYEPLGLRVFGEMDDAWRQTIMHASPFNFPSQWAPQDWWALAWQLTVLGTVAWHWRTAEPAKSRLLAVLGLVTVAAIFGTVCAEELPYALLLQGQPYRALWILAFLHVALVFWLFVDFAQQTSLGHQLAACGLLAYLATTNVLAVEMLFPLTAFAFAALLLRGLEKEPRDAKWLPHSLHVGIVVGGIAWAIYKLGLLTSSWDRLVEKEPEMLDVIEIYLRNLGPVVLIAIVALGLVRFSWVGWQRSTLIAASGLAVHTFLFVLPHTNLYREHGTHFRADLKRVRAIIDETRDPSGRLPTVYSNLGCLDYVWIDLHAKSYFDWWQAGGFMFRKEMAAEGRRRAGLVAPFEVARFHKFDQELTNGDKELIGRFFQVEFDAVTLSTSDLGRLSQEPGLDYLLLEQRFDGLYAANHGRLFLYRCRDVRVAMGLPDPGATLARTRDGE